MHILITGGSGRIGRVTAAHLLAQGHRIRILDREAKSNLTSDTLKTIQSADYHQVDITDYASLRAHFADIEAIVHLAAIPYPAPGKDAEIFDINGAGTFNIYQAAAEAGIQRVVSASSINALGNKFGVRPTPLHYFPIDEDHPPSTSDVYSFSKQIVEEMAAYFWRRNGISGVCMRFPWVYDPAQMSAEIVSQNVARIKQEYQTLTAMSAAEQEATLQDVEAQAAALRQQHTQGEISREDMFAKMRAIPYRALLFGLRDFWAILDIRDAAQAIDLALTGNYEGCHILNIADSVNSTGLPTADLATLFYPEVTTWKQSVAGVETLFRVDKARDLIGFVPQHSIRRYIDLNV